jgi:hypothetical protein
MSRITIKGKIAIVQQQYALYFRSLLNGRSKGSLPTSALRKFLKACSETWLAGILIFGMSLYFVIKDNGHRL